ncbi:hypothetical protein IQ255_24905 [Pleurocapsales cyanobacterium LEGE 10410]|nr:hypothetical protein [Pleurocapsales cyanobacterium LEGE 10410]
MKNVRTKTCNRDPEWVAEHRYDFYVVQYCNVSFGGDEYGFGGHIYEGQDFIYKAPYEEEYKDGTIHELITTESEATRVVLCL